MQRGLPVIAAMFVALSTSPVSAQLGAQLTAAGGPVDLKSA